MGGFPLSAPPSHPALSLGRAAEPPPQEDGAETVSEFPSCPSPSHASLLYFSYSTCHPDMEGCLLVYVCLSVLEPQLRAGVLVSAALSTTACGLFPITYYLKQNRTKQQCQIY